MKLEIDLLILQFQTKNYLLKNLNMNIHIITKCKIALTLQHLWDNLFIHFQMQDNHNFKRAVYSQDLSPLNPTMIYSDIFKISFKSLEKIFQIENLSKVMINLILIFFSVNKH